MNCEFCEGRKTLQKIMDIIDDELPEIGSNFYDDPITDLYNSADNALSIWRCVRDEPCTHSTGTVLHSIGRLSVVRCDWGCDEIHFKWTRKNGVTVTFWTVSILQ